jgi:hypothetical protein
MAMVAALLLSPVAWTPQKGLEMNSVCAGENGTCCDQADAICFVDDIHVFNAYFNGAERCPKTVE